MLFFSLVVSATEPGYNPDDDRDHNDHNHDTDDGTGFKDPRNSRTAA
jgi:hypothetical protein